MAPFDSAPAAPIMRAYEDSASSIDEAAANTIIPNEAFAGQWVRLTVAIDALRSLLEDSYVDWSGLTSEVRAALRNATEDPLALIGVARRVALLKPLDPIRRLRSVRLGASTFDYIVRIAPKGRPGFLIGTGTTRELPILDDTVTDPRFAAGAIAGYAQKVAEARERFGVSYLIFIDKNFGPVGALGMISSVVNATGLPATIYRERKWSKNADFVGYKPQPGDRGVIVYDLVNTGAAIRNATRRVYEAFASEVCAAAVLYNLRRDVETVEVPDRDPVIVLSLDGAGNHRADSALPDLRLAASNSEIAGECPVTASRSVDEPRNGSAVREALRDDMDKQPDTLALPEPESVGTLPPLTETQRELLARIRRAAAQRVSVADKSQAPLTLTVVKPGPFNIGGLTRRTKIGGKTLPSIFGGAAS